MKPSISLISTPSFAGRMKKLLLLFVIALFSTHAFAAEKELEATPTLRDALYKEFNGASDVKWYSDDNQTYMAKFTLKEHNVTAYFDKTGQLLATRRYISEDQLPMAVSGRLAKRYPKEVVRWVVEFEKDDTTVYYVTLEGPDNWRVVKASAQGDLSVHQNLKKA